MDDLAGTDGRTRGESHRFASVVAWPASLKTPRSSMAGRQWPSCLQGNTSRAQKRGWLRWKGSRAGSRDRREVGRARMSLVQCRRMRASDERDGGLRELFRQPPAAALTPPPSAPQLPPYQEQAVWLGPVHKLQAACNAGTLTPQGAGPEAASRTCRPPAPPSMFPWLAGPPCRLS